MQCWGNSPVRGKCQKKATHFFLSLVPASEGVIPAHRAVCDECYEAYRMAYFVRQGVIREVLREAYLLYTQPPTALERVWNEVAV